MKNCSRFPGMIKTLLLTMLCTGAALAARADTEWMILPKAATS